MAQQHRKSSESRKRRLPTRFQNPGVTEPLAGPLNCQEAPPATEFSPVSLHLSSHAALSPCEPGKMGHVTITTPPGTQTRQSREGAPTGGTPTAPAPSSSPPDLPAVCVRLSLRHLSLLFIPHQTNPRPSQLLPACCQRLSRRSPLPGVPA